jgi:hypothetical protein
MVFPYLKGILIYELKGNFYLMLGYIVCDSILRAKDCNKWY